jgi:hypothetical protein
VCATRETSSPWLQGTVDFGPLTVVVVCGSLLVVVTSVLVVVSASMVVVVELSMVVVEAPASVVVDDSGSTVVSDTASARCGPPCAGAMAADAQATPPHATAATVVATSFRANAMPDIENLSVGDALDE